MARRLQQMSGAVGVHGVNAGLVAQLAGKMIETAAPVDGGGQRVGAGQIAGADFHALCPRRRQRTAAAREDADCLVIGEQRGDEGAADETGGARDEHPALRHAASAQARGTGRRWTCRGQALRRDCLTLAIRYL